MMTPEQMLERYTELLTKGELTWEEMKEIEPALGATERLAEKTGVGFYGDIKTLLVSLVGWDSGSKSKRMHTSEAYELAYDKLVEVCGED